MKSILALIILLANFAVAQRGPIIVISKGDEPFQNLPGLIGLKPHGSDNRCLSLLSYGPSNKSLVMNIELLNIGDADWEPLTLKPGGRRVSSTALFTDLSALFRIQLFDTNGVQVVSEYKPGHRIKWDLIGADFSPPQKYDDTHPGLSPNRAAVPQHPVLSEMYVQVGHLPNAIYTVRVTLDPLAVYGQNKSVDFEILLEAYQITVLQ